MEGLLLGLSTGTSCLLIILIMFPGLDSFSVQLAKLSFMKVNPTLSGGDVARSVDYGFLTSGFSFSDYAF